MCIACQIQGSGWAAYEAAVLVGGPVAYAGYRRVRALLGLRDTAAVPLPRPAGRARGSVGPRGGEGPLADEPLHRVDDLGAELAA